MPCIPGVPRSPAKTRYCCADIVNKKISLSFSSSFGLNLLGLVVPLHPVSLFVLEYLHTKIVYMQIQMKKSRRISKNYSSYLYQVSQRLQDLLVNLILWRRNDFNFRNTFFATSTIYCCKTYFVQIFVVHKLLSFLYCLFFLNLPFRPVGPAIPDGPGRPGSP